MLDKNIKGKKIKKRVKQGLTLFVFALLLYCINYTNIYAEITGKGSKSNPYIVSSFEDLDYALTDGKRSSGKTYIAVSEKISIKKKIDVEGGNFYIYAHKEGAQITKSKSDNADINNPKNPTYCIRVGMNEETFVEIGCAGKDAITLGGQRSYYENNKKLSSGWLYVGEKGSVKLGSNAHIKNMINNDPNSQLSNLTVFGYLSVDCTIENCKSKNGGAMCAKGNGKIDIQQNAVIKECYSETEGGALWIKENAILTMYGGVISDNVAKEEGGGIFISGKKASANIIMGYILKNESSGSAGGIFSGYGATLTIGKSGAKEGPLIDGNISVGSGGGIRPNGGTGDTAGGSFYFYAGTVSNNVSGKHGGGIGIGEPGSNGKGIVYIEYAVITGNRASKSGGGIYISKGNVGVGENIEIKNSRILKNSATTHGGGIFNNANISLIGNEIKENMSAQNGGGICVESKGNVITESSAVQGNSCEKNGSGIYLEGTLKVGGAFSIGKEDVIYLCKDKYVEVHSKYTYNSSLYMTVDSEIKNNGTKLIYVTYKDGTGENLLYGNDKGEEEEYTRKDIAKYIGYNKKPEKMILRSAGKIKGVGDKWIIISERYNIFFVPNSSDSVKNMPESQVKFYEETTIISDRIPTRDEYEVDESLIWNTSSTGKGDVYPPGSEYKKNSDITLYIFWKKSFIISIATADRYYMVGQNIKLNEEEILKKVEASDNMTTGYDYKIFITRIVDVASKKIIFDNNNGVAKNTLNKYLTTNKEGHYKLTLYTRNVTENKENTATMEVWILANNSRTERVRFISYEYLYTLDVNSIWQQKERNQLLKKTLRGVSIAKFQLTAENIKEIRGYITDIKYEENSSINREFYTKYMEGGT